MYSVQQSRKVSVTQGRENYPHSDIRLFKVITCAHLPTQASLVAIVVHINVNETVCSYYVFNNTDLLAFTTCLQASRFNGCVQVVWVSLFSLPLRRVAWCY